MFDLNLLPLNFLADQEQTDLPGFLAVNSPRRTARGRAGDQLIVLAATSPRTILPPNELKQQLERLAQGYFETAGSVTAALRIAAERLNQALIDRNLHAATASQLFGSLNLAVIHSGTLFIAAGGNTHSYLLSGENVDHFFDPQPAGKSLGLARPLPLRFYQTEIKSGDELIFCPDPPSSWGASVLSGSPGLALDQLLRRLLVNRPADLAAGVVQFQSGPGKISIIRMQSNPLGPVPVLVGAQPMRSPASGAAQPIPAQPVGEKPADLPPAADEQEPAAVPPGPAGPEPESAPLKLEAEQLAVAPQPQPTAREAPPAGAPERAARPEIKKPSRRNQPAELTPIPQKRRSRMLWIARLWQGSRKVGESSARASGSLLSQILPGPADQPGSLSRGTMAFIAIAIPLIVVAVATTVYNQRGRGLVYDQYFEAAQQAAQQAQTQQDPAVVRSYWQAALSDLQKADSIKTTDASQTLRVRAQNAIDDLDGITRLDYQPAIAGGLAATVNVSQIITSGSDLYLLDSAKGRVIRAVLSGSGYEVDPNFSCEPGPSGGRLVGPLLAMIPMPKENELNAAVMGLDAGGTALYCVPGQTPFSASLTPPESGWGKITAMTYDSGNLYLLDAKSNAIWIYTGSNGTFKDAPQSFFDQNAPPMADAISFAVDSTDLYLLHADGHLIFCTLSLVSTSPTRCSEPAQLSDPRPGHQSPVNVLPGTRFAQILYTQPPDASIYFSDPASGSIYHFSLRLNLQSQMRGGGNPAYPLPQPPATAFTISQNRRAFLAFGSQVYYALIP